MLMSAQRLIRIGYPAKLGNSENFQHDGSHTKRAFGAWFLNLVGFSMLVFLPNACEAGVVAWGDNTFGQCNGPADLTNALAVAAGQLHTLALRSDGTVVAWGGNLSGQTDVPQNLSNVVAIAAGINHNLALKNDGNVVVWGAASSGQAQVPAGTSNVVAIAAGYNHNLALLGYGSVVAWGDNPSGQPVPNLKNVVSIAAGASHNLALLGDGTVVAWGDNSGGQTTVPAGLSNVVAIAAGINHSLALRDDGTVVAWGFFNTYGQTNVPAGLNRVAAIAAGSFCSLALKGDGTLAGWGNFDLAQSRIPPGLSNVIAMAAGYAHSVAISGNQPPYLSVQPLSLTAYSGATIGFSVSSSGSLPLSYQWRFQGNSLPGATGSRLTLSYVQLVDAGSYSVLVTNSLGAILSANAVLTVANSPPIILLQPVDRIARPGETVVFSVKAAGSEPLQYQWRFNGVNLAGAASPVLTLTNVKPDQAGSYEVVTANSFGTVASAAVHLTVASVFIWELTGGVLAAHGLTNVPAGLTNAVALAVGTLHCLGLKADGTVVGWGNNTYGQAMVPDGLSNVVALVAGDSYSLALNGDGTLTPWGKVWNGVSGNNSAYVPFTVPSGLSNVVAIWGTLALKSDGTIVSLSGAAVPADLFDVMAVNDGLALKQNGTVVAWGSNYYGQAVPPVGLGNVVAIGTGPSFHVALKSDGTVAAWGWNNAGQTSVPAGLANVVAITPGDTYCLALKSDGTVVSWGGPPPRIGVGGPFPYSVPAGLNSVVAIGAGYGFCVALTGSKAPSIVQPPSNSTVYNGGTAIFSVSASGSLPLNYQWRFKGSNIPGATRFRLVLPNAQAVDVGEYSVLVSNSLGSVLSSNAVLSITNNSPIILVQPIDSSAYLGGSATFSILVDGSQPFRYQWRFEGMDIPGATNDTCALNNIRPNQAGNYDVLITNDVGMINSTTVRLSLLSVIAWGDNQISSTNIPPGLSNIVAVAGGSGSVLLRADGTVVNLGYPDVPAGLGSVMAIAAGDYFALALKNDGTVAAWGNNSSGETNVPARLSGVLAIAAGGSHSLALKSDGTMVAWGNNSSGESTVPAGLSNIVAIAASYSQSLALLADGTVRAWGKYPAGPADASTAVPVGLSKVIAIAAGLNHSLALKGNGTVVAWGGNNFVGQTDVPLGLSNVVAIAAGAFYSLALNTDSRVVAWGDSVHVPSFLTNVVTMAAGKYHSLAILDYKAPSFVMQPKSATTSPGGTVIFLASAIGTVPLNYQWRFQGNTIAGATNTWLAITNAQFTNAGEYSVLISNVLGSVLSTNAILTVVNARPLAPRFTNIQAIGNDILVSFAALAGLRYRVETRDSLTNLDAPWITRFDTTNRLDGLLNFLDPSIIATTPARFYRIEAGPQ